MPAGESGRHRYCDGHGGHGCRRLFRRAASRPHPSEDPLTRRKTRNPKSEIRTNMNITPRTANAALAASILSSTALPAPEGGPWQHGRITTANDSLFTSTHYSEPMTNYAVGWSDPEGYDRLVEFLAPSF